ncbi:Survival motor neuron [Chamberlinius hualienensis]
MAAGRTVLYVKGDENSDEDIWDDSALIAAYDRAVGLAKEEIKLKKKTLAAGGSSASESGSNVEHSQPSSTKRHNRGRKGNHNKNKKHSNINATKKWAIGDRCRAKYSGDGVIYEAEIISIDEDSATCYVSYIDYGNGEEFYLDEILPAIDSNNVEKSSKNTNNSHGDYRRKLTPSKSKNVEDTPLLDSWQPTGSQPRVSANQVY